MRERYMQLPKTLEGAVSVKSIYLIRHCKASGQESSAVLTDEGKIQAEQLVDFFDDRRIQYIVSSPYNRAVSTIQPLARKLSLNIHIENRLSERVLSTEDITDWMNKLRDTYTNMDQKFIGGETSREAMARGVSVIGEMIERAENRIVIVTHGNLMSLILKHFNGHFGFEEWKSLTNPDVYELTVAKSGETIVNRIWK